jgi:hypothetical protein
MQFALGKAGLSEFKVENGALMVPQRAHGAYLHAVAENDAIPDHLRDEDDALPAINPFMTRSQQRLITENEKKRQIRDMVTRLPFVEQAWFEMDTAEGGSAFEPARQSAVISIRPPAGTLLDAYQVATLRQMIGGAMAGIDPKDIVVIDVSAGYAHQDQASTPQFKSVSIEQRPVLEQKSHYTNRVREALKKYGPEYADIGIDVQVEMFEVAPTQKASFQPPVAAKPESRFSAVMGTNGVASIYDQADQQRTDESVQPIRTVDYGSRVTVALAVPQSLVDGLPTTFAKQGTKLQTPVPATFAGTAWLRPASASTKLVSTKRSVSCFDQHGSRTGCRRSDLARACANVFRKTLAVVGSAGHWPGDALDHDAIINIGRNGIRRSRVSGHCLDCFGDPRAQSSRTGYNSPARTSS